jgi:hypothetical protein
VDFRPDRRRRLAFDLILERHGGQLNSAAPAVL